MRQPARFRKYALQRAYYVAGIRRQAERSHFFMIASMATVLVLASCSQKFCRFRDNQHPAPISQPLAKQV